MKSDFLVKNVTNTIWLLIEVMQFAIPPACTYYTN